MPPITTKPGVLKTQQDFARSLGLSPEAQTGIQALLDIVLPATGPAGTAAGMVEPPSRARPEVQTGSAILPLILGIAGLLGRGKDPESLRKLFEETVRRGGKGKGMPGGSPSEITRADILADRARGKLEQSQRAELKLEPLPEPTMGSSKQFMAVQTRRGATLAKRLGFDPGQVGDQMLRILATASDRKGLDRSAMSFIFRRWPRISMDEAIRQGLVRPLTKKFDTDFVLTREGARIILDTMIRHGFEGMEGR